MREPGFTEKAHRWPAGHSDCSSLWLKHELMLSGSASLSGTRTAIGVDNLLSGSCALQGLRSSPLGFTVSKNCAKKRKQRAKRSIWGAWHSGFHWLPHWKERVELGDNDSKVVIELMACNHPDPFYIPHWDVKAQCRCLFPAGPFARRNAPRYQKWPAKKKACECLS